MKPDIPLIRSNGCAENPERRRGVTNNSKEAQDERLERVRNQAMTKLGIRIRHHDSELTTSPQTLCLARQTSMPQATREITPEARTTTMTVSSSPAKAQNNGATAGSALPNRPTVETAVACPRQGSVNQLVKYPPFQGKGRRGGRAFRGGRARWASHEEMRSPLKPARSIDSNAFGSHIPSDVETATGDSVAAVENGSPGKKNRPAESDAPLADWNGDWQPPPVDWSDRPRFNHDSSTFITHFGYWNDINAAQTLNEATGLPFIRLSRDLVEDCNLHPDGLHLVDATMSVDVDTAERYGYVGEDALATIRRDARLPHPGLFEEDWGKLDPRDAENAKFKDERCEDLIRNYNSNIAKERQEEIVLQHAQKLARRQAPPLPPAPNPHIPRINIYLRPALQGDLPQLQDIYNSYVTRSVRTSETQPILDVDMSDRWTVSSDEKLPFLVAVSKSAKIIRSDGTAVEKIVGWASATDWVNRNSVERFAVELEIYVHQGHTHKGVGKCLMDKLIESTDRGHTARKGYPFSCAPEVQHTYSAGGVRNLMRLIILVRSFDKPKEKNARENDLPWIKKWLEEEWKFEQQGFIRRVGVKFKRYVNHTYFVRSTAYSPPERGIPDG